tara:strand:- start:13351 stop:14691 length:1341 start_codon:yes stop_codon:yes gene_type:complete
MGLLNITQQGYYDENNYGNYEFVSLHDIISQFMFVYVGEDKIIPKARRTDVAFHAQRALAELSFDTFKSCKSQEITVPASLQMILPQDYVNYTKVSWVDSAGIKHIIYPTDKTSNPSLNPLQDTDGVFTLQAVGTMTQGVDTSIVLDAEYKNILVGMRVLSPNIPDGSVVYSTTNSGGVTTIKIAPSTIGPFTAIIDYTGTQTFVFKNSDGSLILPEKSSHILKNITYVLNEDKLTQSPNTDVSSIEVGMLVSNKGFPVGTTVIDVNGAVITTSNPSGNLFNPVDNTEFTFISPDADTDTWSNYKSSTPSENQDNYQDDTYWPMEGQRYGLDPQHAQTNGSFYIDCNSGKIHFSSNISGKTVILDYISDSLGTDDEMQVHKFAEEAMYKWIAHAILSGKANIPEYQVNRFKKERFAAIRTAKLRLSNIKLEELTQILRGKSKQIKH